jgi:iron complex outermembrane recepter protein
VPETKQLPSVIYPLSWLQTCTFQREWPERLRLVVSAEIPAMDMMKKLRTDFARERRDRDAAHVPHERSGRTAITATYLMVAFDVFFGVLAMPVFSQQMQQAQPPQAAQAQVQPQQTASQSAQSSGAQTQNDLTQTSVEDLLNVEVTSVSKKEQKLSQTAAAVFVISAEDIARSGARNIPDLLRMVPGMDVAQINQNSWAIAARGFNALYSSELLVTVDGRIVYAPSFGGVEWDVVDMPLEDIERIEVIRGSAGSIWGANAVNGIVNIITKKAADTHGGIVVADGGSDSQADGLAQYGGTIGRSTDYRVYAKYSNQGELNLPNETEGGDGWHSERGGFRIDSNLSAKDSLSIQGSIYQGVEGSPVTFLPSIASSRINAQELIPLSGGFLQAAYHHTYSESSDATLQVSYDQGYRGDELNENRGTIRIDFQQRNAWGKRQTFVWGFDFANSDSHTTGQLMFLLNPPNRDFSMGSGFVQDEIAIVQDKLYLTVGTKVEDEYFNGVAVMPTARVAWMPEPHHTLWAAASRSLRTPAERDASSRINVGEIGQSNGLPVVLAIFGNPDILNEAEVNWDAGYRATIGKRLSYDLSVFYDHDTNQETAEPGTPFMEVNPAPMHLVVPLVYENLMYGEAHGIEAFATWEISDRWTLSPGAAFEEIHMHLDPQSQDTSSVADAQGSSPDLSVQLRSHVILPRRLGWDTSVYYVGRLTSPAVPPYTRLDTGLTWNWSDNVSISAFGQNLLKQEHLEFVDENRSEESTLMRRGAYAKLTFTF